MRVRHDLRVRRILEKHGIKVISNNKRGSYEEGVLVTQYCKKLIVQLNGIVTKEEMIEILKGLDMEIVIY